MYCSRKYNVNELSMAMMAWIVLKETAETENLDPPPIPQLTQQPDVCWCVIRGVCICVSEAMGHGAGADNIEITILVYSSALSGSAPQMACVVAAELTETPVKNDPLQHVACDRVSSEGIVRFYLTFNSTRQVSISHQIVQTRANVCVRGSIKICTHWY